MRVRSVFLARVCVKCVSLDTDSIPPEIKPPPGPPVPSTHTLHKSLHPPCLLKCVCWCVCVLAGRPCLRWTGVCVPCTAALAGGNRKKTAVCVRENRKRRGREWRANRHASQDRHFWSEYHHLCFPFSASSPRLSLSLVSSCYLALPVCFFSPPSLSFFCCSVLLCFVKILGRTRQTSLSFHILKVLNPCLSSGLLFFPEH